jgi:uncharacterized protein YdiU (UPF0061 family)
MHFNPRYSSLNSKLYHQQQPSPLRGAKAGHFNEALANELQWSDEDKANWVEICSGQKTLLNSRHWQWCMQVINLVNGQVN